MGHCPFIYVGSDFIFTHKNKLVSGAHAMCVQDEDDTV